jgi:pimeloyl-ACP methyl ester carboxylesterase
MMESGPATSGYFPYPTRLLDTPYGRMSVFDEGHGEAIVLVHGLVGNFTHYKYIAPALVERFRVIGVDLPGCGGSERAVDRYTVGRCAYALLSAMTQLGVDRATLVGHSAGGQVVARAAATDPRRADRVVLLNPSGLSSYPLPLRLAARYVLHPRLVARLLGASVERILNFVFHRKNSFTTQFLRDQMSYADHALTPREQMLLDMGKVFRDLGPELLEASVVRHAEHLTMPVLVVWGDRDRLVPVGRVRAAVAGIPGARLHIIEDCGHIPMVETPDETLDAILPFLRATANGALG